MRPSYGIDAAPVIRNLTIIGIVLLILSAAAYAASGVFQYIFPTLMWTGIFLVISAVLMLLYALFGKFHHRERILKMIDWKGDEQVLDVGTGRGLLMIGAAKLLDTGHAYGIDIFKASDLSGNDIENTRKNMELEGVASRTEVRNEDAREMTFADEKFDVILSNLCLHNIPDDEGRAKACREIARVLKPGGIALISDFQKTKKYAATFREAGLAVEVYGPYLFSTYPPLRIVKAQRPKPTAP